MKSKLPRRVKDLTGHRFGRLIVLKYIHSRKKQAVWLCKCDCENVVEARRKTLVTGKTRSCGCLRNELSSERITRQKTTHGMHGTPEYHSWRGMIYRCTNQHGKDYAKYGGRGIAVCAAWRHSFEIFYTDMGPRPSSRHSLDRIDPNGNYEPTNCRWADEITQQRNRRQHRMLTFDGRSQPLSAWAVEMGLKESTLAKRLKYGWTVDQALTTQRGGKA